MMLDQRRRRRFGRLFDEGKTGNGEADGEMPANGKMTDGKPAPARPAPPLGGKVRKVADEKAARDQAKDDAKAEE